MQSSRKRSLDGSKEATLLTSLPPGSELASREFENLLNQRRIDMLNTVGNYDTVRASLAEVRSLIERELAR